MVKENQPLLSYYHLSTFINWLKYSEKVSTYFIYKKVIHDLLFVYLECIHLIKLYCTSTNLIIDKKNIITRLCYTQNALVHGKFSV